MSEYKVTPKRLANFELLRTVSMFFIVLWHSLVHGLCFATESNYSHPSINWDSIVSVLNYFMTNYLMSITAVAVNCYILITGYFMVYSSFKWTKILNIWLQTSFYSFCITLLMTMFGIVDWGIKDILFSVFPIWNDEYWFVTKYLALIFIAPFLSKLAISLTQQEYKMGLILFFILNIYLGPYFSYGNVYGGRYSLLWFMFLFFVGGYIKLYNPLNKYGRKFGLFFFVFTAFISLVNITKDYFQFLIYQKETWLENEWWFGNNSYTFFTSLLLFLWIKHSSFKESTFLHCMVKIAPFTFGVYLLHDNILVRDLLWKGLNLPQYIDSIWLIFILFSVSFIIFIVAILLDYVRSYIFVNYRINDNFYALAKVFASKMKEIMKLLNF